jgi:hypothetical protein
MQQKLITILLSAGLWLCGTCTYGVEGANAVSESERLMRAQFDRSKPGGGLLVQHKGDTTSAELCLDGCDYFEWKGSAHDVRAWNFISLFTYQVGLPSSSEAFKQAVSPSIPKLLASAAPFCSRSSDAPDDFKCRWAKLAGTMSMRVGIATYDEGLRCLSWRDLKSMTWPKKSKCAPIAKTLGAECPPARRRWARGLSSLKWE